MTARALERARTITKSVAVRRRQTTRGLGPSRNTDSSRHQPLDAASLWLRAISVRDVIAGLSVAALLVPQSLAYAQVAGFPPIRGLYAAAVPPLVAAPLASSPYLQPGPTAITALLTYGALSPLAPIGSREYVELGLLLALLVGAIRVAIGLLRAGVLAYLMSEPMLVGFVPAAAILIVASQVPALLGAPPHGANELYRAGWTIAHAGWVGEAFVIGCAAAAVLLLSKRLHPLFPGVLVAIVATIVFGRATGYRGPQIGHLHAGLPPLTRSLPLTTLPHLLVPALVIALIGFAEASSIARTFAARDQRRWDANREFVSQGVANVAAGLFGGFPVGASFSRSSLNRLAGARTSLSAVVTGLAVLALVPLGGILSGLPQSVLAATVIVAVVPLIRLERILAIARLSRVQLWITLTAFVLTLALAPHVEWAIVSSIGLSIIIHLWRELRVDVASSVQGDQLTLIPEGVLWFGTAHVLEDRFLELLATHRGARRLTLQLDRLGRIDLSGAFALKTLIEDARGAGLIVAVRGFPSHSSRILRRVLREDAA
jgi:SulP family sulfate permease